MSVSEPCPSFPWFFFGIPWLILSKEFPWLFVHFLWFFQGFSGFGRGCKSLVYLRVFLGKHRKSRKGRTRKSPSVGFAAFGIPMFGMPTFGIPAIGISHLRKFGRIQGAPNSCTRRLPPNNGPSLPIVRIRGGKPHLAGTKVPPFWVSPLLFTSTPNVNWHPP